MFDWFTKRRSRQPESFGKNALAEEARPQNEAHVAARDLKARGDECFERGVFEEAAVHYRRAIAGYPAFAEAHSRLADVLREQGRLNEAIMGYRKALELAPTLAEAHFGLGVCSLQNSDFQNAEVCFRNVLALKPDFARAHNSLGFIALEQGRIDDALAQFQKSLDVDPGNGMALHLTAALTGSNPSTAPRQYVEKLFDGFAGTFDAELRSLGYETPKHLLALVLQRFASGVGKWDVLDLGCGTGWVGEVIAPHAGRLVGVDLSARMLDKARARNVYQRLEQQDLLAMMQNEPVASYDVVISADTFIYVGRLEEVVREARRLLRPDGCLAFSVEALEALASLSGGYTDIGYRLQEPPSCRYAHSRDYILKLAADNGFKVDDLQWTDVRMSHGGAVKGYLALLSS